MERRPWSKLIFSIPISVLKTPIRKTSQWMTIRDRNDSAQTGSALNPCWGPILWNRFAISHCNQFFLIRKPTFFVAEEKRVIFLNHSFFDRDLLIQTH